MDISETETESSIRIVTAGVDTSTPHGFIEIEEDATTVLVGVETSTPHGLIFTEASVPAVTGMLLTGICETALCPNVHTYQYQISLPI